MTEKPTTTLGIRLRDARLALGMTQDDLAAGQFSKSYVSAVELGKIRPSVNSLRTLAGRLDQPVSYFLEEEDVVSEEERVATELADAEYQVLAGNHADALIILSELRADALRTSDRLSAMLLQAEAYIGENDPMSALSALDRVSGKIVTYGDSEELARLRHLTALAYIQQGKANLAIELERKALAILDNLELNDPQLKLAMLGALSHAYLATNRPDDARRLIEEINETSNLASNPQMLAQSHLQRAEAERTNGRMLEARRHLYAATALQEMIDCLKQAANTASEYAQMYTATEDNDSARSSLEQAMRYAQQSGNLSHMVRASNKLAAHHMKAGNVDEAERLLSNVQQMFGNSEVSRDLRGQTSLNMALLHQNRNQHDRAEKLFRESIADLEASNERETLSQAYFQYGQALVAQGKAAEGAQFLEKAYRATRGLE